MTLDDRFPNSSRLSARTSRRSAFARKARAQHRLSLEALETRQLLAASVTNTLAVDINPAVAGDSVTFTALIAPSDSGTPTGQVTFKVDGVDQTPVDLHDVGGHEEATFSTSSLAEGGHTVTATYGGDSNYDPATSNSVLELINSSTASVATTTALSASANPASVGDSVTFTAVVAPGDSGTPTGQVVFTVDGAAQTPVDLQDVGGQQVATFTTGTLTVGTHSVTASYTGDDTYLVSSSDALNEKIDALATTTTVTSSANPSTAGDGVTFTAVVAAAGTGTPSGQVTFKIDGVDQTPVDLQDVGGQQEATFATDTLAPGDHTVVATYGGGGDFAGSASDPLTQGVNAVATTTALSASANPALLGQSVTFTAVVTANDASTPTGQVVFTVDGVTEATVDLENMRGQQTATFTTDTLSLGSHTVVATYTADSVHGGSSDTLDETVQAATATSLSPSSNPSTVGDSVTFTAVVTTTGTGVPTGQVTFNIDGADQTPVDLQDVGGQQVATFTTDTLAVGSHTVTATYGGGGDFVASTSSPLTQDVNKATTTTTLSPSENPATLGTSVTFTAVVATSASGVPTGQVTFKIDGVDQTPVDLQDVGGQQVATFTTDTLTQGSHTVVATYDGDDTDAASTSDVLNQVINSTTATVSTTTTLGASANPVKVGDSVTFTAVVAPGDSGVPTGQVVFTIDGVDQTPVDLQTVDGQQVATLTTDTLPQGSHTVVATYNGDATYLVSSADPLNEQVQAATTTAISAAPNPSTVGASVTFTAVVSTTGTGAPTGQVVFTIDGADHAPVEIQTVGGQQVATLTTDTLAVGQHTVVATYVGDTDFVGSASDSLTQAVSQATTTTGLSASANPSALGASVTFTASVSSAAGVPTGQVTFTIDGVDQTPVALQTVGDHAEATFDTTTLALGTHTVSASYAGDTDFGGSASTALTQAVVTDAQAGAPTLAPESQTGAGSGQGYTKDNGSAGAPLVLAIPNPNASLFYRLYDVTDAANPVLLAGPSQLSGGQITVDGHTLTDGTHKLAYTTAGSAGGQEGAQSQAGIVIVQTSLAATFNPSGNFLTVLPNNQVVITFDHWLVGLTADQADGSGFTSNPFAVTLIPSGPNGKVTQLQTGSLWSAPSGVDGGGLPVPATLVYHQNADGTSTITLTARQPLASDVYLISVSGALTDLAGNTLSDGNGGLGAAYSSFAFRPTPADATPLAIVSVTSNNGSVVIDNNLIAQPDTIAVRFNKPLDLWTANGDTVQLWQKNADGTYERVQATAIYSPSTNSVYLTPGATLSPGTVYVVSVYSGISDDQAFPNPGGTLGQDFFTTFQVNAAGVGAGQSPLTVLGTNPANGTAWTSPLGYGSVTFSEAVNLSSFGRYSAMLVPHTGGVTTGGSGYADVPYNALLAINPNTNQLIIVPTGILTDNTVALFALSNITASNGDPLTNPGGDLPVYSSFLLNHGAQTANVASTHAALTVGRPAVAGTVGALVTADDTASQPAASVPTASTQTPTAQPHARRHRHVPNGPLALAAHRHRTRHHG